MHSNFNFKKRLEEKKRRKKIIFYTTFAFFVCVLFCAGFLISESSLELENQDRIRVGSPILQFLPLVPVKSSPVENYVRVENYVKNGDTIINILKRGGIAHAVAYRFFTDLKTIYNLKKIAAGNKYTLFISKETKELVKFKYEIDLDHYLEAWKDNVTDTYKGKLVEIPYEVEREFVSGEIHETLFASILEVGEEPELADMMASLFEYDIDFNRDIQEKDSFSLLVEKMFLQGEFVRYGHILAVEFTNRGKTIRVIRYTDPEGYTAYYHPDGGSVRKMFLRCPLPFMRVTSRYGNRRHPLSGFSAKHLGVDFGAPTGTKIRATASGIIRRVSRNKIKGRYIYISHKNSYVSHYYHLSRFASGIKVGRRVEQGQIIGYVGSTGWSTGPHLHYGLQKNRRFLNPLSLNSPSKDPVKKIYLKDFKKYAARISLLLTGNRLVKIPQAITEMVLETPNPRTQPPVKSTISIGY